MSLRGCTVTSSLWPPAGIGWAGGAGPPPAPADRLALPQAVLHYRGGWSLERDCHQLKDLPLGLSPLLVGRDDQTRGLTPLLTLALRRVTLIETPVRRALEPTQQTLTGLYEGQPARPTERPTGKRLLKAFARARLTLTPVQVGTATYWHLTPLATLPEELLRYLLLPVALYSHWRTIPHKPRKFTRK